MKLSLQRKTEKWEQSPSRPRVRWWEANGRSWDTGPCSVSELFVGASSSSRKEMRKKKLFSISVNFQLFKFALNWLIYFPVVVEQWQCRQTTVNIKDSHTTSSYLGLQICYAAIWLGTFHLTVWVSFAFIRTLYRCLLMQVSPVLFSFSKKQKSAQILFVKLTRTCSKIKVPEMEQFKVGRRVSEDLKLHYGNICRYHSPKRHNFPILGTVSV